MTDRILGAIIAGGQARRFGSDKALALLDGEPLIAHAAAQIAPFVAATVVCGREWGGLPALADVPAPGLGPLGGIAAALAHAAEHGFVAVLTIACDMPAVPGELIEALVQRRPSYCADALILGCWPAEARCDLLTFLRHPGPVPGSTAPRAERQEAQARGQAPRWTPAQGRGDEGEKRRELSIRHWARSIGATPVPAPSPLRNINTPADLS